MLVRSLFAVVGLVMLPLTASAQTVEPGNYLCTVDQRAGVGGNHLEGSGPPTGYLDKQPRIRFRISIARGPGFTVVELPYEGPDASGYVWQDDKAVLHSTYLGDGYAFTAKDDQAFLRMATMVKGVVWFYHAGFEYAGGEDVALSVRYGTCEWEKPGAS